MTRCIAIERVYAHPAEPGPLVRRLLVDRVWPRGLRKSDLDLAEWVRDVAPSTPLRQWFGHRPARWATFRDRYRAELAANPGPVQRCLDWVRLGPVVLLYGARDPRHNQAVVLAEYLNERIAGCPPLTSQETTPC